MKWSEAFIPTLREEPAEAEVISHRLMLRAGLIRKLSAGVYTYLPLGYRVLSNVMDIIRAQMDLAGAQEILMPALQPAQIWNESGRYEEIKEIMINFKDRHGREFIFGPTHEEVVTDLVKKDVHSYKDLPFILYQIQTKFRDEARPRFGVLRSKEFIMKDAYSFDSGQQGLDRNYKAMLKAYHKIFENCGLNFLAVEADPGLMGGDVSCEFMAPALIGEDKLLYCKKCDYGVSFDVVETKDMPKDKCPQCSKEAEVVSAIEIGHIFKLGTKYSEALGARFLDEQGNLQPIIMGCYGIGVNRIIAALIEQSNDVKGIIWPLSIAPYKVAIIPLDEAETLEFSEKLYSSIKEAKVDVLLDNRNERGGVKFKDADLIGTPYQIIAGKRTLNEGMVEIKERRSGKIEKVKKDTAVERILDIVGRV